MTVGEVPYSHDMAGLAAYVLPQNNELNMVFHFELMDIDDGGEDNNRIHLSHRPWKVKELADIVTKWQTFMTESGFWNT